MKRRLALAALLSGLVVTSSVPATDLHARIIVRPLPGMHGQQKAAALWSAMGFHVRRTIPQLGIYVLDAPRNTSANVAVAELAKTQTFMLVEEDRVMRAAFVPNDPDYSSQWSLTKVNFSKAWSKSNGAGITVAVLDTGINCSLAEFNGQCVSGWNIVDNNGNTNDDADHGTGVASQIAAATNNGVDIASAAWGAKVMPVKINQDGTGTAHTSDIAAGIVWAADHGAKVANLSFANGDGSAPAQVIKDAAFYLRQKGGILFESAGNSSVQMTWTTSVIDTVSATDNKNKLTSFSNYGKGIDFAAPGEIVPALEMDGTVATASGTSISSPLAASVAALMLSVNPSLLPWQLENLMATSTTDKGKDGWDQKFGWGVIDAKASVDNAFANPGPDTTPPDAPNIYSGGYNGTVHFSWNQGEDNTGPAASYLVYRNGVKIGKTSDLAFTDPSPIRGATSNYTVKSVDGVGLTSVMSNVIAITVPQ